MKSVFSSILLITSALSQSEEVNLVSYQPACSMEDYHVVQNMVLAQFADYPLIKPINEEIVGGVLNYFDADKDGVWSKKESFDYLFCLNNHTQLFNAMNYNNDTVLSVREMVSYFMNLNGFTKDRFNNKIQPIIQDLYSFNVDPAQPEFYEYVANLYANLFNDKKEPFVTFDQFSYGMNNISFVQFDANNDGYVEYNEFKQIQFDTNTLSDIKVNILDHLIDSSGNPIHAYSDLFVSYNESYLLDLELKTCFSVINDTVLPRRRLNQSPHQGAGCALNDVALAWNCGLGVLLGEIPCAYYIASGANACHH